MKKFGIENVRGGSFSNLKLSKNQKNLLQLMIFSSENKCFHCGSKNHFAKDCKFKLKKKNY